MAKNKYPVGYKFNYLTILEYCGKEKNSNHCFYKCKCDCGNIITIRSQQINIQKSCGCYKSKINPHQYIGKHKYPVGYKFNHLTILKYCGKEQNGNHCFYKCKCDCGNIITIRTQAINKQKSCGCYKSKNKRDLIYD